MSIYEALTVLGLNPRATSWEIKAAYRDLVKVWHPDRFGDDVRLRRKAEINLQAINLAYKTLQSYHSEERPARPTIEIVPQPVRLHPYRPKPNPPPEKPASDPVFETVAKKTKKTRFWLGGVAAVVVLLSVRYGCESGPTENAAGPAVATTPVIKAPAVMAPPEKLDDRKAGEAKPDANEKAEAADTPTPAMTAVLPGSSPSVASPSVASPASKPPNAPVNDLPDYAGVSAIDQASIEAACAAQKILRGHGAYVKCVKRQLVDLSHAPAAPDLSALDYAERESIESACANEASLKGPAVYRVCVIQKVEQKPHPIHLP